MEGLKELIRNLAFILLLATFLEMLLPNKKMRGFVQLVMGLFVIAAIINPLASFLRLDFNDEVPAWVTISSTELPVLAAEGNSEKGKSAVREQYSRILSNQIRILVMAVDGVKQAEVDVELEKDAGGFSDYPKILKITIVFSQQSQVVTPISPVLIGEDDPQQGIIQNSDKANEIRNQVSALMQISENIITVREKL